MCKVFFNLLVDLKYSALFTWKTCSLQIEQEKLASMKKQDEDKDKRDKEEKESSREKRERSRSPRRYNTMNVYLMFYSALGTKVFCV